jgi:menaquinone-dependent protoporphyrinogen oxidase
MTRRDAVAVLIATPVAAAATVDLIRAQAPEEDMDDGIDAAAITGGGVLVLYNTRAGQSRRIATFLAERARTAGLIAQVADLQRYAALSPQPKPQAALLVAGIQVGTHGDDVAETVRSVTPMLAARPSALVSVSLSAAHPARERDAERYIREFIEETGWRPDSTLAAAGALRYTRYGLLKRIMMKQIASKDGLPTDTSRDHEFTDWKQVSAFGDAFFSTLAARA